VRFDETAAARVVGAVVETCTVTDTAFEPGVTDAEDKLQEVVCGAPAQLNATGLENVPAAGEICSVYVAVAPALIVSLEPVLESVKSPPTPLKPDTWGLPAALSLTVTDPVRAPVTEGVNVTLIAQLLDGERLAGQLFVCEKSPEICTPAIERSVFPLLVRVRT